MVLILNGNSEQGTHIWNISGILITLKNSPNPIFFGKDPFYFMRAHHAQSYHLI